MSGDRSVMPSAARLARARRAGLRPRSRWLGSALSLVAVLGVMSTLPPLDVRSWGQTWQDAVATSSPAALVPLLDAVVWLLATLAASVAAARVLAIVAAGGAGGADARERRRLRPHTTRRGGGALLVVSALALLAIAVALRGVIAGAVRGVDASPASVVGLWTLWPQRAVVVVVVVLIAAAMTELWVARRRISLSLRRSPQQVREERARSGRAG